MKIYLPSHLPNQTRAHNKLNLLQTPQDDVGKTQSMNNQANTDTQMPVVEKVLLIFYSRAPEP